MTETKHALLSASSAKRWLNCPPSARLCEGIKVGTSIFAEEGTLAHELGALKLEKIKDPSVDSKGYKHEIIKSNELYSPEMEIYTDEYVDYINPVNVDYLGIEKLVDFSNIVPEGFGTADCITVVDNTLNIYDLKYGMGVKVEAPYNPQVMLYAIGTCNLLPLEDMDIQKIQLHIIQPRMSNISTFKLSMKELTDFGAEVRKIAPVAYEGRGKLQAGEWCKFCTARGMCKAHLQFCKSVAGRIHQNINCVTREELGYILDVLDDLEDIKSKAKEQATKLILNGESIQGYKVVAGRSVRKFRDEAEAFKRLEKVTDKELYEKKPLSLAKIEKIVGKKKFAEVVGDCVYSPQGNPTLVKADDPRQEYKELNSADKDFENIDIKEL